MKCKLTTSMYMLFGMFVAILKDLKAQQLGNMYWLTFLYSHQSYTIKWLLSSCAFQEWCKLWSLSKKLGMCFEISYECVLNKFPHIELECKYCVFTCHDIGIGQSFPHKPFISSNTFHPQECSNVEYVWNWRECGVCYV